MKIKYYNNDRQYHYLKDELLSAYDSVLKSGDLIDGEYTFKLEEYFKKLTGRQYALAVNSCTSALQVSLKGLLILAGPLFTSKTQILYPGYSYKATLNAIDAISSSMQKKAIDVDSNGLMKLRDIKFIDNVFAVMGVNLFGLIPDYTEINTIKLLSSNTSDFKQTKIIEDAAQSLFSYYDDKPSGSFGDVSCFSFDSSKIIGTASGGMLVTDNYDLYSKAYRAIRNKGDITPGFRINQTMNSGNLRITENDAAALLVKLNYIESWLARRRKIADYYFQNIKFRMLGIPKNVKWNAARFPIFVGGPSTHNSNLDLQEPVTPFTRLSLPQSKRRDTVLDKLFNKGIETKIHYQYILNQHDNTPYNLDKCVELSSTELSIPIYPELTDNEVDYIVKSINNIDV